MILYQFLGDEDRAMTHQHEATELAHAGIPGAQLSDGTTISIVDEGGHKTAFINSPFLAEYIVLAPRAAQEEGYVLELYGYNHRRDAMVPNGDFRVSTSFSGNGFDAMIGFEAMYISDGIAGLITLHDSSSDDDVVRDPKTYIISFGFSGTTEDLQTDSATTYTVQGFPSTSTGFQATTSYYAQGSYLASLAPYGVDRTVSSPVYRYVIGTNYEAAQSMIVETYNSGNSDVQYKIVTVGFLYASIGKDSAFDYGLYQITTGVMRYDDPGGMISSQFPVMVPLGNNRAVAFFKRRTINATYLFGGEFSLGATLIEGTGFSQTTLSTTGLTNGWFYQSVWNHGTSADTNLQLTSDTVKINYLLDSMAYMAPSAVPLSQDETLVAGHKIYVGYNETNWASAANPWSAQVMCYAATSLGVSEKGAIVSYFDEFYDGTYPGYGSPTLYRYTMVGMLGLGGDKVVAFFHRRSAAFGGVPAFAYDGLYRFNSADGGETWSAPVHVYLEWGEDGPPSSWIFSPPKHAGYAADGEAIILLGVTFATAVTGGLELTDTTLFNSSDSGLNFVLSPTGTVDLAYVIPTGGTIFHRERGMTSVQDWGNHEDGYAPSPYRHLPTYYGTPTAACRDSANDAGL